MVAKKQVLLRYHIIVEPRITLHDDSSNELRSSFLEFFDYKLTMYPWIGSSSMPVVTPRHVTNTLWEPSEPTWISVGYIRGAENVNNQSR